MVSPTARATWNLPRTWYPPSRSLAFGIFLETCEKFCWKWTHPFINRLYFLGFVRTPWPQRFGWPQGWESQKKARQKGKRASGRFQESEVDDRMHIWEKRFTLSPILKTFGVNVRIGLDIFSLLSEAAGRMVSLESVGGSLEPRARTTWKTGWRPKSVKPSAVYFPGRDQESKFAEVPNLI